MSQVYVDKLTAEQKTNIAAITAEAKRRGITNPYALTGLLTIASKETEFKRKSEDLTYTAKRITEVWPSIPMAVAVTLEKNPEKLGNYVYGPKFNKSLGNGEGEGYKYRGRGLNQLTGKKNYEAKGKSIGVDLVNNPDRVNEPDVAAKIFVDYYITAFQNAKNLNILKEYNTVDINGFKNLTDSVKAMYDATRGWGNRGKTDTTGGYVKATSRAPFLTQLINFTDENKGSIAGAAFFLLWQFLVINIANL